MKKAGDILNSILGQQEAAIAKNWSTFFRGWQSVAGDDLAAHSVVRDVKQGSVLVEVDHPGWLQMFQLKKSQILKTIKNQYPELDIRDIRCFLMKETPADLEPVEELPLPQRAVLPPREQTPESDQDPKNIEGYEEFQALLKRLRDKNT